MSTAKPRKTSTRGTTRKRNGADGPVAADSLAGDASAIDASLTSDTPMTSSVVDLPAADLPSDETEHEIRIRAYELYLSRGSADGDDLSDWLEAERIVRNSRRNGDDEDRENRSSLPA